MKFKILSVALGLIATAVAVQTGSPKIQGEYIEVRSCDVYTGPCFANAEVGLTGKECILSWNIKNGSWDGVNLNGLKVIAVVRTDGTLGDLKYQPRSGPAVLIVDAKSTPEQAAALQSMARGLAGNLINKVVAVKRSPVEMSFGTCSSGSCGKVYAQGLVEISTRCFGEKDHVCGNEETFYPPLLKVDHAIPAFTEIAAYTGSGLDATWETVGARSAFLGHFSR